MLDAERPWLSIYGGKLSGEPIGVSLNDLLEEAVEKHRGGGRVNDLLP